MLSMKKKTKERAKELIKFSDAIIEGFLLIKNDAKLLSKYKQKCFDKGIDDKLDDIITYFLGMSNGLRNLLNIPIHPATNKYFSEAELKGLK